MSGQQADEWLLPEDAADEWLLPDAPARPGLGARFMLNAEEGRRSSLGGAVQNFQESQFDKPQAPAFLRPPDASFPLVPGLGGNPVRDQILGEFQGRMAENPPPGPTPGMAPTVGQQREAALADFRAREAAMPPWYQAPTYTDMALEGGAALAGQLAGGMLSPENLVGPLAGGARRVGQGALSYLGNLFARGAATQAPVGAAANVGVQALDMAAGDKQEFSPEEVALAGALGGALGGGLNVAPGLARMAMGRIREFRTRRGATPDQVNAPVTPEEALATWSSEDVRALAEANGVTDPADPFVARIEERLGMRRAAEADPLVAATQRADQVSLPPGQTPQTPAQKVASLLPGVEDQVSGEVASGMRFLPPGTPEAANVAAGVDSRLRSLVPEVQRPPEPPPVIALPGENGRVRGQIIEPNTTDLPSPREVTVPVRGTGEPGVQAGAELRTGQGTALVPVERPVTDPAPRPMEPGEVARAQAQNAGGTSQPEARLARVAQEVDADVAAGRIPRRQRDAELIARMGAQDIPEPIRVPPGGEGPRGPERPRPPEPYTPPEPRPFSPNGSAEQNRQAIAAREASRPSGNDRPPAWVGERAPEAPRPAAQPPEPLQLRAPEAPQAPEWSIDGKPIDVAALEARNPRTAAGLRARREGFDAPAPAAPDTTPWRSAADKATARAAQLRQEAATLRESRFQRVTKEGEKSRSKEMATLDRTIAAKDRQAEALEGRAKVLERAMQDMAEGRTPPARLAYDSPADNAPAIPGKPVPPTSVVQRIREMGGMRDDRGDFAKYKIPGLVNNKAANSFEDIADTLAYEGFFPNIRAEMDGGGVRSINVKDELMRAIEETQAGRPVYTPEGWADYEARVGEREVAIEQAREVADALGLSDGEVRGLTRGQLADLLRETRSQDEMAALIRSADEAHAADLADFEARMNNPDEFNFNTPPLDEERIRSRPVTQEDVERVPPPDSETPRPPGDGEVGGQGARQPEGQRGPEGRGEETQGQLDRTPDRPDGPGARGAGDAVGGDGQGAGRAPEGAGGGQRAVGEASWKKNPSGDAFLPSGHTLTIGDYQFQVDRNVGAGGGGVLGNHLYVDQPKGYKPGWAGDPGIFAQAANRAELEASLRNYIRDGYAEGFRTNRDLIPNDRPATQAAAAREAQGGGRIRSQSKQRGVEDFEMFDPEARKQGKLATDTAQQVESNLRNKLYSGAAIFDPETWKVLFGPVSRRLLKPFAESWKEWGDAAALASEANKALDARVPRGSGSGTPLAARVDNAMPAALRASTAAVRTVLYSDGIAMRAIADRLPAGAREALHEFLDGWHANAGVAGSGKGATYAEGVSARFNRAINQLESGLGPILKDQASMDQVVKLVQNPSQIRPGSKIHDAAASLRSWLAEHHAYMRENGVDVGQIKRGYFPRRLDIDAVWKDQEGFSRAAERAYRASGMSPDEAKTAAAAWLDNVRHNGADPLNPIAAHGAPGLSADHVGERILAKSADEHLAKFLQRDAKQVLVGYAHAAARRAELTRVLGPENEAWTKLGDAFRKAGAEAALGKVGDFLRTQTGHVEGKAVSPGLQNAIGWVRLWGTMGLMSKATITSLTEIFSAGARSGRVVDSWNMLRHMTAYHLGMERGERVRLLAEDVGTMANHLAGSMAAARWTGGRPTSSLQQLVGEKYFRAIGLEQWTHGMNVGATGVGDTFIRRMANDLGAEGRHGRQAAFALAELGIPREKHAAFAAWVKKEAPEGMTVDALAKAPKEIADSYRAALFRFTRQVAVEPSAVARPRWANSPLGSLAFHMSSFAYAMHDNVLMRAKRVYQNGDLTTGDKLMLSAKIMSSLALAIPAQLAIGEARSAVFDSEKSRKAYQENRLGTAVSRSGIMGAVDPWMQIFTGLRYRKDLATSMAGPTLGRALGGAQVAADAVGSQLNPYGPDRNRTDTEKRKLATALYDVGLAPAVNFAATRLPLPIAAAVIQGMGASATREAFVAATGGPPPRDNRRRN